MLVREYKLSWIDLTLQYAKVCSKCSARFEFGADTKHTQEFVSEFFDQNPISQMAIVVTRDGQAERLSPLGGESEQSRAASHSD